MPCIDVIRSKATRYELSDAKKIKSKIEDNVIDREPFIIEVKE